MRALNPHKPVAHYSNGIEHDSLIFVGGQVSMGDEWQVLHEGDMGAQTHQVFDYIESILAEAGATLSDVLSTTVYVANYDQYKEYNRVYAERFGEHRPARATVRAELVRPGLLVEIQAVARKPVGNGGT